MMRTAELLTTVGARCVGLQCQKAWEEMLTHVWASSAYTFGVLVLGGRCVGSGMLPGCGHIGGNWLAGTRPSSRTVATQHMVRYQSCKSKRGVPYIRAHACWMVHGHIMMRHVYHPRAYVADLIRVCAGTMLSATIAILLTCVHRLL